MAALDVVICGRDEAMRVRMLALIYAHLPQTMLVIWCLIGAVLFLKPKKQ